MGEQISFWDAEFGEVVMHPARRVRRLIFKVKEGVLHVSCPVGIRVQEIENSIEENRVSLRQLFARVVKVSQRSIISVGDSIPYYGGEIVFLPGVKGRGFHFKYIEGNIEVYCPQGYDLNNEYVWVALSKCVCRMVKKRAEVILPQRLNEVAECLGIKSVPVSIGRGKNKLGHCTARGEIQLSYRLMFYPEEIIDYIICHELAHLTYMNHGPEFHALCNQYCGGRETELRRKARAFKVVFG